MHLTGFCRVLYHMDRDSIAEIRFICSLDHCKLYPILLSDTRRISHLPYDMLCSQIKTDPCS